MKYKIIFALLFTFVLVLLEAKAQKISYKADILNGFESLSIKQPDDYEGKVICTIVKKQNSNKSNKAVLYVHGFSDYFFQKELAENFIKQGYNFYAIDIRKYGRSILPNQKANNVRNLTEYYADLDTALKIIKLEGNKTVILNGHSTGGLLISLYAAERQTKPLFNALILNSPFLDMNLGNVFLEKIGIPLTAKTGAKKPDKAFKAPFNEVYGKSLHKDYAGEWDYNLLWKPLEGTPINLGWVNAIHQGHLKVKIGLNITQPVLLLHSNASSKPDDLSATTFKTDVVLDVKDMKRLAPKLGKNVKEIAIKNGIHDLILSKKPVRNQVYNEMFSWLNQTML